jgi:hypothetical protein
MVNALQILRTMRDELRELRQPLPVCVGPNCGWCEAEQFAAVKPFSFHIPLVMAQREQLADRIIRDAETVSVLSVEEEREIRRRVMRGEYDSLLENLDGERHSEGNQRGGGAPSTIPATGPSQP